MDFRPGPRTRAAHAALLVLVGAATVAFVATLFPQLSGLDLGLGATAMLAASLAVGVLRPVLAAPVVAACSGYLVLGPWAEATEAGAAIWVAVAVSLVASAAAQTAAGRREAAVAFVPFALLAAAIAVSAHSVLGALGALSPVLGGTTVGLWMRLRAAQRERRALAEREARADERLALAAELHDLATARLTRIVIAARAEGNPAIEADARAALDDLRRVVVGLQAPEVRPVPLRVEGVSPASEVERAVHAVVDRARASGQRVDLRCGVAADLPRATADCLARVVEEGLTNARKHAAGAPVSVSVTDHAVRVTNPRTVADDDLAATGSGTGLRGLAARTSLVGGALTHGRSPDGAWTLAAVFE